MKSNKIYIGNIYDNQTIKIYNAILIKAKNKKYLELHKTKKILNMITLELSFLQNNDFISNNPNEVLFVKEAELKPYISVNTEVDLKRVRKIHKKK